MKPNFENTFFVLDFDRCLGNTDKAHETLLSVIEAETGIDTSQLQTTKQEIEAVGSAFDTIEYVTAALAQRGKKSWQQVREVYIETAKQQGILEPQAEELLELLDARQIPYGVLTFGKEAWQLTKLEAAGLVERGVPFEITRIEHKGKILTGWKHGDEFIVPPAMTRDFEPLHAESIVFLDDKPRSFIGMPVGVHGVCVRPTDIQLKPSQQGALPPGVDEVQGLAGAIKLLF